MYNRVTHLKYLAGSDGGALYHQPWMEPLIPQWAKGEYWELKSWQWLGLLIGFFLGWILKLLVQFLLELFKKVLFVRSPSWKVDLFTALEKPAGLFVAACFGWFWLQYLKLEGWSYGLTNGLIQVLFGISTIWALYHVVGVVASYLLTLTKKTESTLDDQLVPFVEKTIKLLVIVLGILIILQNMGVNVFSLLAGLGLGGLAFALAAQDTAANLFGSLMILIDQPFKIGDWVIVDGVEGSVEEIGFRSTRVRTFYSSLITVPNAAMAKAKIDNMGARRSRRTRTQLDVIYSTSPAQLKKFTQGIRDILDGEPLIEKGTHYVYFNEYGPSSLKILLYFFIQARSYDEELATRQSTYLKIYELAESLGVEFAFPTQTLYLQSEPDASSDRPEINC